MRREPYFPEMTTHVVYDPKLVADSAIPCIIDDHIKFDAESLQSYTTDAWNPMAYDTMLLAAVVEFCDSSKPRSTMDWGRKFNVKMPVHDVDHWNSQPVKLALSSALGILTGDVWNFNFEMTTMPQDGPSQAYLDFPSSVEKVIPYSDGLDSLAIGEIFADDHHVGGLVRVRVGSTGIKRPGLGETIRPFANIPFKVRRGLSGNGESSGRSRGFKFAILSGLAAYLVGADSVVVPESGQGSLGPVLVNVGQNYPDRRAHPQFTSKMTVLFETLLGKSVLFEHPMIWGTKGETLSKYKSIRPNDERWRKTRSCWKDSRQASVNKGRRQCGVCAACMLRQMSLHAAGLSEVRNTYVWEDLGASEFWDGAHPDNNNSNAIQRHYAIAGVLHMDHIAALGRSERLSKHLDRHAVQLSKSLGLPVDDVKVHLVRLIEQHNTEWREFVESLPRKSFVRNWALAA